MRGVIPDGDKIRTRRLEKGMTQVKLAETAGLDIKTVRKAERSVRLDLESIDRISQVLELESSELLQKMGSQIEAHYNLILRWRELFIEHDAPQLVQCYHPEAKLIIAGGSDIPFGGEYEGREQIAEAHITNWQTIKQDSPDVDDCTFILSDNGITLRGECRVYLPSGDTVLFPCVMLFTFQEGLIIRHEAQFDTLEFAKRLGYLTGMNKNLNNVSPST